jgi:hypothetical protein
MMRVKLVLAEDQKQALPNLNVSLYDRDWKSDDDVLGTGISDAKGEIYFQFDEKKYKDNEDGPDWRVDSLPDLYVNVTDESGKVIYSTRDVVEKDKFPQILVVPIPEAILQRHGLFPRAA